IFRKEIIRDLHMRGRIDRGTIQLHSLTAQLPGAADLQLIGASAASPAKDHFVGGFNLSAGNLRGTLDWLGLDTSRVPAARLRRASASGRLTITSRGITLHGTKLDVDTSRLEGKLALDFGKRPRLRIDAAVDRIDMSAYMPRERPQPAVSTPNAGGTSEKKPKIVGKTPKPASAFDWRKQLDAVFAIRVAHLTYEGRTASAAEATGTFERGVLTLTRAKVTDLGGVGGEIRGTVTDDGKQPKLDLTFDGSTTALSSALGLFGFQANPALDRFGTVLATGTITGTKSSAKLKATVAAAGGRLSLDGNFVPSFTKAKYGFRFALDHPRAEELVTALAVAGLPADVRIGRVRMSGMVRGDLAKAEFPELKIAIGGVALTAVGAVEVARARPLVTGEIKTGNLTIQQLLAAPAALIASGSGATNGFRWSKGLPKETLILDGLKVLDANLLVRPETVSVGQHKITDPLVELELRDGALNIKRAGGRIFGGDLSMRANLRSEKSTLVDGMLTLRAADLTKAGELFPEAAFRAGKLNIDAAVKARGASVYGLVAGLNGTVAIRMRKGAVAGFDLAGINRRIANQADAIGLINLLTEGMSTGTTKFDRLDGKVTFVNGVGEVKDLKLTAEGGSATGKGQIALVAGRIDGTAAFHFAAIKSAPPLVVALSGKLDDLKAVFRFNALQRHLMARHAKKP
ncbi:MAG: AsmA family protein, partial [Alphaproteobacteria bacterium]|nr:AsmA family protein [Alphaproteobacteria bacterium]